MIFHGFLSFWFSGTSKNMYRRRAWQLKHRDSPSLRVVERGNPWRCVTSFSSKNSLPFYIVLFVVDLQQQLCYGLILKSKPFWSFLSEQTRVCSKGWTSNEIAVKHEVDMHRARESQLNWFDKQVYYLTLSRIMRKYLRCVYDIVPTGNSIALYSGSSELKRL